MSKFIQKHKIVIVFNSITVLILALVSVFIYTSEFNKYEKLHDDFAEGIVEQSVVVFDEWINNQIELVHSLSENDYIIDMCLNPTPENVMRAKGIIEEHHTDSKYYHMVTLSISSDQYPLFPIDTVFLDSINGRVIGDSIFQKIDIMRFLENEKELVSTQFDSMIWGKNVIEIGVPIINDGKMIGIINGTLLIDQFGKSYLSNTTFGESGFLALLDYNGKIIAHKDKEALNSLFKARPDLFKKAMDELAPLIRKGNTHYYASFLSTKKRYYSSVIEHDSFDNISLHVVYGQDYNEIFDSLMPLKQLLGLMILTFLAFSSLIFIITTSFNRQKIITDEIQVQNKMLEDKVKEREEELNTKMKLDSMTKIFNHNYMFEFVEEHISNKDLCLSAFMIDLDFFKRINDQFGHQVGDEVIMRVVTDVNLKLNHHMAFGRYGGEEFLVINHSEPIDEMVFSELLRSTIEEIEINDQRVKVTASIGVVRWNNHTLNQFIKAVDDAVYHAKKAGRNCVYLEDS